MTKLTRIQEAGPPFMYALMLKLLHEHDFIYLSLQYCSCLRVDRCARSSVCVEWWKCRGAVVSYIVLFICNGKAFSPVKKKSYIVLAVVAAFNGVV